MTTTISPNGTGAPETGASAQKTAPAKPRSKKEDGADIGGFFERVRARTEAAKLKKLKAELARRGKELVAAADVGIAVSDLAGDVLETTPFYKDLPKSTVAAALEEIMQKERAKAK